MTGERTQILRFAQNDRMGDWNDGSVVGNGVGEKSLRPGLEPAVMMVEIVCVKNCAFS